MSISDCGYICIGRITAPHGLRGECRVQLVTDFPERLYDQAHVWVQFGASWCKHAVERFSSRERKFLIKLKGLETRDDIHALIGRSMYIREENLEPLLSGMYYWHDLIGCDLVDFAGEILGRVVAIERTPAHDLLVVELEGFEYLVPIVDEFIRKVDISLRRICVSLIEGMGPEVNQCGSTY